MRLNYIPVEGTEVPLLVQLRPNQIWLLLILATRWPIRAPTISFLLNLSFFSRLFFFEDFLWFLWFEQYLVLYYKNSRITFLNEFPRRGNWWCRFSRRGAGGDGDGRGVFVVALKSRREKKSRDDGGEKKILEEEKKMMQSIDEQWPLKLTLGDAQDLDFYGSLENPISTKW